MEKPLSFSITGASRFKCNRNMGQHGDTADKSTESTLGCTYKHFALKREELPAPVRESLVTDYLWTCLLKRCLTGLGSLTPRAGTGLRSESHGHSYSF